MGIRKVEYGIHTIELSDNTLKYHEVQKIVEHISSITPLQFTEKDKLNINRIIECKHYADKGVRIKLRQTHNKSNSIAFIITPHTVFIDKYDPVALYTPKKDSWKTIRSSINSIIKEIRFNGRFNRLSLSRIDLTADIFFDDAEDLQAWIRIFYKSIRIPKYQLNQFRKKSRTVKDSTEANRHSFCIRTSANKKSPDIMFKVYDKVYELCSNPENMRCSKSLRSQKILRLELSLRRAAFLRKLHLTRKDKHLTMLEEGCNCTVQLLQNYLYKLTPCTGEHVQYDKAVNIIQSSKLNDALKAQMLNLLKKTSRSDHLTTATQKLIEKYDLKGSRIKKIYAAFNDLGISPITIPNDHKVKKLPSIRTLL